MSAEDDPASATLGALAAIEEFASAAGLDARGAARLAVVIEELVSNAIHHGLATGTIAIDLTLASDDYKIALIFEDDGIAFDPTEQRAFNGPDPVTGGGVGLELVRAWATAIDYVRENGRNRIELMLRLG